MRLLIAQKLQGSRARGNYFARGVRQLFLDHTSVLQCQRPHMLRIQELFANFGRKRPGRVAFRDLLLWLDTESCEKLLMSIPHLDALARLASHRKHFKRKIDQWHKPCRNLEKQFISIIHHCITMYPVPVFLEQVWMADDRTLERGWYIALGSGQRPRDLQRSPIRITRKIGHWLQFVPCSLDIDEGLRWAQVRGLGGDERTAEMISESRLSRNSFENEHYWEQVIQFFIDHELPSRDDLDELLDFLNHQLELERPVSITGRSIASLTRLA
ncbi:MAG: hypothetical protein M3R08_12375, partial [Bacteroidota bacterium]|nr:hypothetical protein [Bacteroidota bacterium]